MMHSAALHCRLHDALPCAHCALCILHIVHIVHYKALQCIAPGCILLLNSRLFVAAVHCLQETEQKRKEFESNWGSGDEIAATQLGRCSNS